MTLRIPLRQFDGLWDTHEAHSALREEAEAARREQRPADWTGLAQWGRAWAAHSPKGEQQKTSLLAYCLEGDDLNDEDEVRGNLDCVEALLGAGWDACAVLDPRSGQDVGKSMCECLLASGHPLMEEMVKLLGQYNGGFVAIDLNEAVSNATIAGVHWCRDKDSDRSRRSFEGLLASSQYIAQHLREGELTPALEDTSMFTMACLCPSPESLKTLVQTQPRQECLAVLGVGPQGVGCADFWRTLLGTATQNTVGSENTETVRWILTQHPFQPEALTMALKLTRTKEVATLLLQAGAQAQLLIEAIDQKKALAEDPDNRRTKSAHGPRGSTESDALGETSKKSLAIWKTNAQHALDFARLPFAGSLQKELNETEAMRHVRSMVQAQNEREELSHMLKAGDRRAEAPAALFEGGVPTSKEDVMLVKSNKSTKIRRV